MKKYGLFDDIYIEGVDEEGYENNHMYELLSEHSEGLNEFLWDISEKLDPSWGKEPYNYEKDLRITIDYLVPLLKEGKIEVRIRGQFEGKEDFTRFYHSIKTKTLKERLGKIFEKYDEIIKTENGSLTKKFFNENEIKKEEGFWIAINSNKKGVSFGKTYLKEEIDSFKEDITNILLNYCKTKEERGFFETFNIGFRLPGTGWEFV